ncbi:MAG TPA: hypothetical protein VM580_25480 [Labilithrix sp.]|nr:hypothetical protein [Labilithrix sp.]
MKSLALMVAFAIAVVGALGVLVPSSLLSIARSFATPVGLYVVAAIRVAVGLLFVSVAPRASRPNVLRALGAFILLSGVVTPFVGVERAREYIDAWSSRGTGVLRLWGVLGALLGGVLAHALSAGPRHRYRPARSAA